MSNAIACISLKPAQNRINSPVHVDYIKALCRKRCSFCVCRTFTKSVPCRNSKRPLFIAFALLVLNQEFYLFLRCALFTQSPSLPPPQAICPAQRTLAHGAKLHPSVILIERIFNSRDKSQLALHTHAHTPEKRLVIFSSNVCVCVYN